MAIFNSTNGPDNPPAGPYEEMYGGAGNDALLSSATGVVVIDGGTGDDALVLLNFGFLHAYGGDGNDLIFGCLLDDTLYGGEGSDFVAGAFPEVDGNPPRPTTEQEPSGNDILSGDGGSDALFGYTGNDVLFGGDGDDNGATISIRSVTVSSGLYGGDGDDYLDGGRGADFLVGGLGLDTFVGGPGADRFAFESKLESGKGQLADVIRDFSRADGDRIDLSVIDANEKPSKPGDQAFKFSQADDFNGKAGQVIYKGGKVQVDVDGNGKADFHIKLLGVEHLAKDDFIL